MYSHPADRGWPTDVVDSVWVHSTDVPWDALRIRVTDRIDKPHVLVVAMGARRYRIVGWIDAVEAEWLGRWDPDRREFVVPQDRLHDPHLLAQPVDPSMN